MQPSPATGLLATIAFLALACGAPTDVHLLPSTPGDVLGRYELMSVGGKPLPVVLPLNGPPRLVLIADTLWLRADSTYEEHMMREVIGRSPLYLLGSFSIDGATIQLIETGALERPSTGGLGPPVLGSLRDSRILLGASVYLRRCSGVAC